MWVARWKLAFLAMHIFMLLELAYELITWNAADSSFVPPLIYAMLGSSRDVAVGTVAVASLLISSMLGKEVSPVDHQRQYVQLVFTATFFAGVFQAALGFLRSVAPSLNSRENNAKFCPLSITSRFHARDRWSATNLTPCRTIVEETREPWIFLYYH